ncbi:MAG: hypothetical protein A2X49_01495 [Lentisphaerae bacterium GWF2_52_8]|nr:MAG: hypothetical protein A2X49_01495 [Lentisphaerae bacterium GWF2_52_8]
MGTPQTKEEAATANGGPNLEATALASKAASVIDTITYFCAEGKVSPGGERVSEKIAPAAVEVSGEIDPYSEFKKHPYYQFMRDDLGRSGIPPEEAFTRGWFPITQEGAETILGFNLPPGAGGGYAISFNDPVSGIPMTSPDGRPFIRVKFARPVTWAAKDQALPYGKASRATARKYLSPKGAGTHCFILPEVHRYLMENPTAPLRLVEGEKKALAATLKGLPTIGLVGIWGWAETKTETGGGGICPDLLPYLK